MRSLWLKLTLSFLVLAIFVALFMAILINSAVKGGFRAYLLTTYRAEAELLAPHPGRILLPKRWVGGHRWLHK